MWVASSHCSFLSVFCVFCNSDADANAQLLVISREKMSTAVPRRKVRREVAPHSSAKECSKVNIYLDPTTPFFFSFMPGWNKSHPHILGWSSRILNVTPAKEQGITAGIPNYFENSSSSKIRYKRIPVYDASTSNLLSHADEMVEFISNGLHHGGVLVHCQKGVSRSATAVVMFLMRWGKKVGVRFVFTNYVIWSSWTGDELLFVSLHLLTSPPPTLFGTTGKQTWQWSNPWNCVSDVGQWWILSRHF